MDDEKQIEFPPLQTHNKRSRPRWSSCRSCASSSVLVIVLFTDLGDEFRPTV